MEKVFENRDEGFVAVGYHNGSAPTDWRDCEYAVGVKMPGEVTEKEYAYAASLLKDCITQIAKRHKPASKKSTCCREEKYLEGQFYYVRGRFSNGLELVRLLRDEITR